MKKQSYRLPNGERTFSLKEFSRQWDAINNLLLNKFGFCVMSFDPGITACDERNIHASFQLPMWAVVRLCNAAMNLPDRTLVGERVKALRKEIKECEDKQTRMSQKFYSASRAPSVKKMAMLRAEMTALYKDWNAKRDEIGTLMQEDPMTFLEKKVDKPQKK